MVHKINTLTFEIECPVENDAFAVRNTIAQTMQEQIAQGIDTICSRYSTNAEILKIEKFEIDLGLFNSYTFKEHLLDKFLYQFEISLQKELAKIAPHEKETSLANSKEEALIFFLETGQLHWGYSKEKPDFNSWIIDFLKKNTASFLQFLKTSMHNAIVWKRIGNQFTSKVHAQLIQTSKELQEVRNTLKLKITEFGNELALSQKPDINTSLDKLIVTNTSQILDILEDSNKISRFLNIHLEEFFYNTRDRIDEKLTENTKLIPDNKELSSEPEDDRFTHQEASENINNPRILASQGGAVLLAQFLKPFFTNLGLLENGQWCSIMDQYRGVHLINYLCTGLENSPEYNLPLEKILCGLPLNATLPLHLDLTPNEKDEAKDLLNSIIEHWSALKNTSITGLQKTFLQRDCLLESDGINWKVIVERQTPDVLLDRLPWPYALIVLPWNNYQIHVEW